MLEGLRRHCKRRRNNFMLPGFRFLFAAILLSISMLIFGLGAAALLRAAHEEFASIPSRHAPPETMFARHDAGPALLRVDAAAANETTLNSPATEDVKFAPPVEQPAIASTPSEPEKPVAEPGEIAALADIALPAENSPPSEPGKPEASTSELPVQAETPTPADMPSPAETRVAAIAEAPAAPNPAASTAPEQASEPADDSTTLAETRIATLGGPPVPIEPQTPSKHAPAVVKKPVQAKHVVKRRSIVQRARVARPAPQRPANPFGTPFGS
jgi:hypothetical protein